MSFERRPRQTGQCLLLPELEPGSLVAGLIFHRALHFTNSN